MNPPFRWEEPAMVSDDFLRDARKYHNTHAYPDYPETPQCTPCWDSRVMEVDGRHADKRHIVTVADFTGLRFFAPCHCLGSNPDPAVVASLVESVLAEGVAA